MKQFIATSSTLALLVSAVFLVNSNAMAVEVKLTDYLAYIDVEHDGDRVRVERIQDEGHMLDDGFAKTSRKCPPFCIQPMKVAPGVTTVGEAEIFRFMERELASGSGLIIDARTPAWYTKGTIPGSINIPFTEFVAGVDAPETIKVLETLGAVRRDEAGWLSRSIEKLLARLGLFGADQKTDKWDFTNARKVVFWCNGPWCGQSPRAIKGLLEYGFPPEKIAYYRGGMQMWKVLGLTVVVPDSEEAVALK
ncbi:MAG: rhodanese-like domain-containing protein [Gammaproteobacteria bacterium]